MFNDHSVIIVENEAFSDVLIVPSAFSFQFLTLDDVKEHKNIDLKEDGEGKNEVSNFVKTLAETFRQYTYSF